MTNDYIELPAPELRVRRPNHKLQKTAELQGLHPIVARVLAARPSPEQFEPLNVINPKLNSLDNPMKMAGMRRSAERVADAIMHKECIGLETDHDCDGQTSHAVLYHNLVHKFNYPKNLLRSYIGHRLTEGYGLSEKVAVRILSDDPRPSLIITADNGSSDEPRIAQLAKENIDVIVTDHHKLPQEGPPQSAYSCLNPTQDKCPYEDIYIAGCMVAWLLMAATRIVLIERDFLSKNSPKLIDTLDFVAVGTVADCVSLARSKNNRAVVTYGLKLINQGIKPCWRAVKNIVNLDVCSEDLGFKIAPLLNSDGRLDSAFGSVSFLLADTDEEALRWMEYLQKQNNERKLIQKQLTQNGLLEAYKQVKLGRYSLCIYLEDGHAGVHGISASRIKDNFGRPTAFLTHKHEDKSLITGSLRGIDGFNVHLALQWINEHNSGLFIAFGGHAGAGGVTFAANKLAIFFEQFELATKEQLSTLHIGPVLWTDGIILADMINLSLVNELSSLEPFGREFEPPIFQIEAEVLYIKLIGDGTHMRITLKMEQYKHQGVWFGFRQNTQAPIPIRVGDSVKCAFTLKAVNYLGRSSCELMIATIQTQH